MPYSECTNTFEISSPNSFKSWITTTSFIGIATLITFDGIRWSLTDIFRSNDGYLFGSFSIEKTAYIIANITDEGIICNSSPLNSSIWKWDSESGCWSAGSPINAPLQNQNSSACGNSSPFLIHNDTLIFSSYFYVEDIPYLNAWNLRTGETQEIIPAFNMPIGYANNDDVVFIFFDNSTVLMLNSSHNFQILNYFVMEEVEVSIAYYLNPVSNLLSVFGSTDSQSDYYLTFYQYENLTFSFVEQSNRVSLYGAPDFAFMCTVNDQALLYGDFINNTDTAEWNGVEWKYFFSGRSVCHIYEDKIVRSSANENMTVQIGEQILYTDAIYCEFFHSTLLNSTLYIMCNSTVSKFDLVTLQFTELVSYPGFFDSTAGVGTQLNQLAVSKDGEFLFILGRFQKNISQFQYSNVAKYSLKQSEWQYFDPIPGFVAAAVQDSNHNIYIGGGFSFTKNNIEFTNIIRCDERSGTCEYNLSGGIPMQVSQLVLIEELQTLYMLAYAIYSLSGHGWKYNTSGSSPAVMWHDSLISISSNSFQNVVPPPFYTSTLFIALVSAGCFALILVIVFLIVVLVRSRKRKDYIFLGEVGNSYSYQISEMIEALEGDEDILKIPEDEIQFTTSLGEGGQAKVFKALYKFKMVAAKSIRIADPLSLADFRKEIKILRWKVLIFF
jgi:hypothetical protein